LYSLRSGLVKLVQHLPNGTERIVRLLRGGWGGDIAGLEIFRQPNYRHTAIALAPINACRIPRASMTELVRLSPRLYERLMDCRERNLETADWWITQLSTGLVDARAARLIRYLKQADGSAPDLWVKLPQRDDMASMLGVTTETLCRTLARFQQAGTLRRVNNRLYKFDQAAIERLALR
jgi:CRP-like cAMP-binding protein